MFLPTELDPEAPHRVTLPRADPRARHIVDILKKAPGEIIRGAVLGSGRLHNYTVASIDPESMILEQVLPSAQPAVEEREVPIDLILAAPRPARVKQLLPHLAALGVSRVMFLKAEKVERGYLESGVLTPGKEGDLRALLLDGAQQAGVAAAIPTVAVAKGFKSFFALQSAEFIHDSLAIVLHPDREGLGAPTLLRAVADATAAVGHRPRRVVLLLGPEGGWNDFELDTIARSGFTFAHLGDRILRTDTAVVAAVGALRILLATPPDPG